jgi:hypothetical protein
VLDKQLAKTQEEEEVVAEDKITFLDALKYSVWLRAGRLGDRGSIPDRGRGFFF